jgi:FkbM family methyltransferase
MDVNFYEAINVHLNFKYQPLIREMLAQTYQDIAGEYLSKRDKANARHYALESIRSLPLRKYFSKKAFMKSSLGIFAISIMPRWAMKAEEAVGKLLNSILGAVGLKLTRKKNVENVPQQPSRHTLRGTLGHAKRLGLEPKTVIDVGAGTGTFELYETFTNSTHILIDPLEENKPYMEKIVERLKNADYLIAAAASKPGTVTINVHKDFYGSSLYKESEGPDVDGIQRTVPAITLDEMCKERGLRGPYLIKVDVQGAELDVLAGASQVLKDTEYVILEVLLMGFLIGGPQLYDVVSFMKERGFMVYDILDYGYRPLDGAMSQVDMAFVKESGRFREHRSFATKEQREEFYAKLLKDRNRTA